MPAPFQFLRKLRKRRVSPQPEPTSTPTYSNMNPDLKNPFASKTIWGAVLVLLGLLGRAVGIEVPKDEINGLLDLLASNWDGIMQLVGAILAIWGRVTASRKVGFSE